MKRIVFILGLLVAAWASANAYQFMVNGIAYNYITDADGTRVSVASTAPSPVFGSHSTYSGDVTIPSSVTYDGRTYEVTDIGDMAFSGCTALTSVSIPTSVTAIGGSAFYKCSSLGALIIPESVTYIGGSAFYGCTGLDSLNIPATVTIIREYAFEGCSALKSLPLGNSVTTIEDGAFKGCSGLTSLTIPDAVTHIGSSAFSGCSGLTSIDIPHAITTISDYAFSDCSGLKHFTFNGVTSIGHHAFEGCAGLMSLIIPETISFIGDSAFWNCTGMTSLEFNSINCDDMQPSTFSECPLIKLSIGNNVKTIPAYLAYGQTKLKSVTIPNSVISIGNHAFEGCTGLTSAYIPSSVTSFGSGAFGACDNLKEYIVDNANKAYCTVGGVLFNRDKTEIIIYPAGKEGNKYKIPDTVTTIGEYAFVGCHDLTSVTIPKTIDTIKNHAFSGCTGLESVTCLINSPVAITPDVFNEVVLYNAILYVPSTAISDYVTADVWYEFGFIKSYTTATGDANSDGKVDVSDLNLLVNSMLSDASVEEGDLNGDTRIDIADVNILINTILGLNGATQDQKLSFNANGVNFNMMLIEHGTFDMGATPEQKDPRKDEIPAHQVTLTNDYYMGETEVTQVLWEAVMGKSLEKRAKENSWALHGVGNNNPIYYVSWNDCQEFIAKLNDLTGKNFRLPTEAEWEFAARGGIKSNGYRYSGSNDINSVAWYSGNCNKTQHVAAKRPNELGLYDMSGNVWEWCQDFYGKYESDTQINPTGPEDGTNRIYRGAGWSGDASRCRVSRRFNYGPDSHGSGFGLRLALSE